MITRRDMMIALVAVGITLIAAAVHSQTSVMSSVIFNASNQLHALKNVGTTPATYHVINWKSPGTVK